MTKDFGQLWLGFCQRRRLFYFGKTRSYNSKVVNYYYDRKEKDMTEITKTDMIHEDVFMKKNDPEKLRVEGIIQSLTSHLTDDDKISYHFGECDGHDEEHFEALMEDLPNDAQWHTIYDSCMFPVFDGYSGYSIIQVAHVPNNDFYYLTLAMGGSLGSSALTEYFKIPMHGNKWAFSV